MASKHGAKSKKLGLNNFKAANSPSSSTTSSSKHFLETTIDGLSSPASSSARSKPQYFYSESTPLDAERATENVTVTVRFRPLNPREIRQGEEIAWYADGETIVRNEYNPSIAYAYDRVFGPTTTTRHVYDIAAQHIVNGAMEGINGTIFAYGVTSSGKTHTMHGDQRSPGIIPLTVKDAFSIIQETPNREFLLRVSYLEIYNEVVNDLLNPAGQNLRIREDAQGTFVEGIKEEVVLSPAHALSLIAAGEEHRHVGSTNFNVLSSRSHTIFTLTVESSPCGENSEGEAVTLSQLNLIDLAGSESSKAETTGMRRREGSYINKSLLTLGTVISKLTEGRAGHIPYRDSKLTRLLQSSLSGHGRVSLICTVTPSSSSAEETHNTLKFAHRAKHIEIQAAQNKIIDEKSLIKKYQHEIRCLKEELEQLKRGIVTVQLKGTGEEDIVLLKQKLEDGQVALQSRLEQEEEAKAALLSRIQRLTKLILVSTKASHSPRFPNRPGPRRRHSFGEEELAYLPYKRRDSILDEENIDLYLRKRDSGSSVLTGTNLILEAKEDKENHEDSLLGQETPLTSIKSIYQIDLLREQQKILSGERKILRRIRFKEIKRLKDEMKAKNKQIDLLEKQIADSFITSDKIDQSAVSRTVEELVTQLNEKSFELEVKAADNRVIQEQLNEKIRECANFQETISSLKQQLTDALELKSFVPVDRSQHFSTTKDHHGESRLDKENGMMNQSNKGFLLQAQIEELKFKVAELTETKEQLELRNQKLAEESSYAKGLASAAAVELKALSEEVAKLMNHNEKLAAELAASKSSPTQRRNSTGVRNGRRESHVKRTDQGTSNSDIKREMALSKERELSYEGALLEKDHKEAELQRKIEESKQREAYLENELANMWVLVAKLKKSQGTETDDSRLTRETLQADGFDV
ncbi:hypothetical protein K1719_040733 [Acacia pycnantha]|nr:hypothetical protein K1719_040733 [Acacia pycnantha]